ncbi:MAG: NPCBM/NEW2 domain-containing protein, partial [Planctomycetota bacterium]
ENDLAFYKFDGFSAANEALADDMPRGEYAREANIDAYIALLKAVGETKPDIFLDPTCGMWLSPWWLKYVDSIWGSVSGDYPRIVVPAPVVRDSATTTRDAVFRQRCREHPGFPPAAIEHLGIIVITPEKWEDNAVAVVGRGCRLLTLYINAKFFDEDRDWAFLASLLKWTRHNAATLGHTTLIGGDPLKREWYGYAHFGGARGIVSLRNPFIEPQTLKLKLDETCGWKGKLGDDTYLVARIVYPREETLGSLRPHSDTLEVRLQAYETMTIHIEPLVAGQHRHLKGVRARETERAGHRASYAVYGRPGQKPTASAGAPLRRATLDGRELPIIGAGGVGLPIAFAGGEQPCRVEGARLGVREGEGTWRLEGSCVTTVPAGSRVTMHVLCDPRGGAGAVECAARVNGQAVEVRAVRSGGAQAHSKHAWTWFEFPLPKGKSEVAIAIGLSKGERLPRCEVGWWLWAEHPLQEKTLTLEFDKPLPPAPKEPLPLPLAMETEREIITIQSPKLVAPPRVWPKPGAPRVWLDEVAPDEAKQDWGRLQRNQSVWGKPMIVAGRKLARGLGTHANSRIVYDLSGGEFVRFRSLVGRDEHAMDGRVVFQVWGDGKKVFDSGPMGKTTPAKRVDVDVRGAEVLELRTLDGGDGIGGDHGNWGDAHLARDKPKPKVKAEP